MREPTGTESAPVATENRGDENDGASSKNRGDETAAENLALKRRSPDFAANWTRCAQEKANLSANSTSAEPRLRGDRVGRGVYRRLRAAQRTYKGESHRRLSSFALAYGQCAAARRIGRKSALAPLKKPKTLSEAKN
ncbi:MAG: hypothetical protein ACLUSP_07435 [Christensenellales bacterium]